MTLARRLQQSPFLIEQTDGVLVVEPLRFIELRDVRTYLEVRVKQNRDARGVA